jgi:tetratricopeptide (TPR) repeat protein
MLVVPMGHRCIRCLALFGCIGLLAQPSLAAFPLPGENPRERSVLPFRTPSYNIDTCKEKGDRDNANLKEIVQRRIGPALAEGKYEPAIARLSSLLKAVQVLPIAQIRSDVLLAIFNPYFPVYDGASVDDLDVRDTGQATDWLMEVIVRQSLIDDRIAIDPLLYQIEKLNQSLGMAHGVPKAITFIRLSHLYTLLEPQNSSSPNKFRQRALVQLLQARHTIEAIKNPFLKLNMLIILGRRYTAMGEMTPAQALYDQSLSLFQHLPRSDSQQSVNLLFLWSQWQSQLGQFEAAWETLKPLGYRGNTRRAELITAMLQVRSPQSVLPWVQQLPDPQNTEQLPSFVFEDVARVKAQALGAVAIAFAKQGQMTQGRQLLEAAIALMPLVIKDVGVDQPWNPHSSGVQKAIDFHHILPLLSDYAKAGQREVALEIAQRTPSMALEIALKALIAIDATGKGETVLAQTFIDEVKTQIHQAAQDDTYPVVGAVFSELMTQQQYRVAWDLFQAIDVDAWESHLIGLTPTTPLSWPFLERIHHWQAKMMQAAIADQRYDIALDVAKDYPPLVQTATLANVAVGRVAEALAVARKLEPTDRAKVLAAISLKLEQQGHLNLAQSIWAEAINTAQQLKADKERAEALLAVVSHLQHTHHQPQVNALLQQIIKIDNASTARASYRWEPLLHNLVESLLWSADPRLAMRLVEALPPGTRREQHRTVLFQGLLSTHYEHLPLAEKVLAKLPNSALKIRNQLALAEAHFTWGQFPQSAAVLNQALFDLKQLKGAQILKDRSTVETVSFREDNRIPWLLKTDNRSTLLGYIALGYTKMNDQSRAAQVVQTLPDLQIQRQLRSHLACYRL